MLPTVDPVLFCGPQGALQIAPRSVHVWSFFLAAGAACREQCAATLSHAEAARAARFVHARNGDDFVVAHGVLRLLLARYIGLPAQKLAFCAGPNGKPALATPNPAGSAVSFNMTHSHGRALIAVSDGRELGIDLEQVNPDIKALAIARRYFRQSEFAAIASAAPSAQAQRFFRYWVAKEAVLKGQGIGLKFPIDGFEVEFDADCRKALIRTPEESRLADDWRIRMLPLEGAWLSALAVRGANWQLRLQSPAASRAACA